MAWRSWLQTTQGRYALQGLSLATGFTLSGIYVLPQSIFIDKYKDFVQSYSSGLGTPVSTKVKQLYNQVLTDLKISEFEKSLLDVFTVYGFDLFHAGSSTLRSGAIIGVPVNFSYETESEVDRRIKVVTKSIDWESQAGQDLRSSLVLSEQARKFGLAREVVGSRSTAIWYYSIYPVVAVTLTHVISATLNDKLRFRQHPFRFIMYGLIALFNGAAYFTVTDLTTAREEAECDQQVASLGPDYARGGVEFYNKLKERNKALRVLMGENGPKLYTTSGNEVAFLRVKTTPLSERLLAMEKILNELTEPKPVSA